VAPVNTDLVPNYATISSFLKDRAWNSVDGQMYGIPHGWGANLLMYNTDVVKGAPDSWGAVFRAVTTRARSPPTTRRSTSPTPRCT
jgi:putative spermidine/putrescine transport system substrate-binding protein